jgi:hypothetical protein
MTINSFIQRDGHTDDCPEPAIAQSASREHANTMNRAVSIGNALERLALLRINCCRHDFAEIRGHL